MQIVDRAMQYPAYCFWTFKTDADGGGPWLDLGRDFDERHDGRMYLSIRAAQTIGEAAGMVKPDTHEKLIELHAIAEERIDALQAELVELQRTVDSIDFLESHQFKARRKPGRPKKEPVDAAA